MSAIYFCISAWDEPNLSKGIKIVQKAIWDGYENNVARNFKTEEKDLVATGWASNSFSLMAFGDEKKVEQFVSTLVNKFDELLCESYEVKDTNDIEFDDEEFEEEFKNLLQYVNDTFGAIQVLEENVYFLSI